MTKPIYYLPGERPGKCFRCKNRIGTHTENKDGIIGREEFVCYECCRCQSSTLDDALREIAVDMALGGVLPAEATAGLQPGDEIIVRLPQMTEDAIGCRVCGTIMVRTGTCYTCPECGENSGCN